MRFLVEGQLPRRLATTLTELGHDTIHALDLPARNASTDSEVISVADRDGRIVVTKDGDFRDGHLLARRPRRLLHVTTGNITNTALLEWVRDHLVEIEQAFGRSSHVELASDSLIVHEHRSAGPQPSS